ncbi:hypothetical protein AAG570_002826 [Ranatra chinensis]|uniref:Uncharacterized protein n=1 Tax=Ranatra chinensis TaxID=642074 RepID=A0ABD0Y516_9HEMI
MSDDLCPFAGQAAQDDDKSGPGANTQWIPPYVDTTPDKHPLIPLPRPAPTVELRGGVLLVGCGCLKRNGMQHDCQRRDCQGKEECLSWPAPVCEPSGLAQPRRMSDPVKKTDAPECAKAETCAEETAPEEVKPEKPVRALKPRRKGPLPGQVVVWSRRQVPCRTHRAWGYYRVPPKVRPAATQTHKEVFEQASSIEILTK